MKATPRGIRLALLIALIATAAAAAPPPSHLNQPVVEHVVLEGTVFPDGAARTWRYKPPRREDEDLVGYEGSVLVPSGQRLVITDVEWQVTGDQGAFSYTDSLWIDIRLQGDGPVYRVFQSRTLPGLGQTVVGASEQLTTGFTVPGGTTMAALPFGANSKPHTLLRVDTILLRGYLIGVGPATPAPTH